MCDYSLFTVNNRLANEADELVLHRFSTGSLGFCEAAELDKELSRGSMALAWSSFVSWLLPRRRCGLTAVCIAPGARLLISEVPEKAPAAFESLGMQTVEFTQLSERSFTYRDAVRLPDGENILLQKLPEGLRIRVLAVEAREESSAKEPRTVSEEAFLRTYSGAS